jgi:hypothetical protein
VDGLVGARGFSNSEMSLALWRQLAANGNSATSG